MSLIEKIHVRHHRNRRGPILSNHLAELIPKDARVLDVGSGDGLIAHLIMKKNPDIEIIGIDTLVRGQTQIPVIEFDGQTIPYRDKSFDAVMFVDLLHHTQDPLILLGEAMRVTRKVIAIKDHTCNGFLAGLTLRLMDWVGNARYGVSLPYEYWPRERWLEAFHSLGLNISVWKRELKLYPRPANWIVGRDLHFVARLDLK